MQSKGRGDIIATGRASRSRTHVDYFPSFIACLFEKQQHMLPAFSRRHQGYEFSGGHGLPE